MTLAKPKSHWRNPRKAIASNLRHHDIAYATTWLDGSEHRYQ